ncbi:hypothetical protein WBG78_23020 [Chryseolinea sp. T2]|uniref:hypothetical protein n=1 Tax=Chryseolinea sp. T2 TaxID=3129255 RepID=UPI0030788A79
MIGWDLPDITHNGKLRMINAQATGESPRRGMTLLTASNDGGNAYETKPALDVHIRKGMFGKEQIK